MNPLQRFENKLEQLVSGVFARTFRSAVQPVEIAAALNREADNSAQILSRDRRLVPNNFHVELSPGDLDRLDQLGPQLEDELVDLLRQHAEQQSYVFTGPVNISLESAEDLTTGRFRVRSRPLSDVSPRRRTTDTQVGRAAAFLVVNGERLPLTAPGIVVGRGNEADLRIDDPGVSRRHLEFRVRQDYGDPQVSVHDLGSTNGVQVDGHKVQQATLRDGAEVRIGNTTMSLVLQRGR